jgi:hypothetical protein
MVEVILLTVIAEEIIACVWLCECERDLMRAMTEKMVMKRRVMEQEIKEDEHEIRGAAGAA